MEQQAEDDLIYGTDEYFQAAAESAGLGDYIFEEEEESEKDYNSVMSAAEMTEEEKYNYQEDQQFNDMLDREFEVEPTDDDIEEVRNVSPVSANMLEARKVYRASNVPANGKQLYTKFVKRGENPILIAGLLGNAMVESSLNPGAIGDGGTSEGLFQWHNERRTGLRQHMTNKPRGVSDAEWQVEYALAEMKKDYPKVYAQANSAKTPSDAAYIIAKGFEKPKVISPLRMSNAEGFYKQIGGLSSQLSAFNNSLGSLSTGVKMPVMNSSGYTPTGNMPRSDSNSMFGRAYYTSDTIPYSDPNSVANPLTVDGKSKSTGSNSTADKATAVVNLLSDGIDFFKKDGTKNRILGQAADSAVTGISSILGERQNQKQFYNDLEKLYGEGSYNESPLDMQLKQKSAYAQHGIRRI
jgi:hypothetical protein